MTLVQLLDDHCACLLPSPPSRNVQMVAPIVRLPLHLQQGHEGFLHHILRLTMAETERTPIQYELARLRLVELPLPVHSLLSPDRHHQDGDLYNLFHSPAI